MMITNKSYHVEESFKNIQTKIEFNPQTETDSSKTKTNIIKEGSNNDEITQKIMKKTKSEPSFDDESIESISIRLRHHQHQKHKHHHPHHHQYHFQHQTFENEQSFSPPSPELPPKYLSPPQSLTTTVTSITSFSSSSKTTITPNFTSLSFKRNQNKKNDSSSDSDELSPIKQFGTISKRGRDHIKHCKHCKRRHHTKPHHNHHLHHHSALNLKKKMPNLQNLGNDLNNQPIFGIPLVNIKQRNMTEEEKLNIIKQFEKRRKSFSNVEILCDCPSHFPVESVEEKDSEDSFIIESDKYLINLSETFPPPKFGEIQNKKKCRCVSPPPPSPQIETFFQQYNNNFDDNNNSDEPNINDDENIDLKINNDNNDNNMNQKKFGKTLHPSDANQSSQYYNNKQSEYSHQSTPQILSPLSQIKAEDLFQKLMEKKDDDYFDDDDDDDDNDDVYEFKNININE